MTRRVFRFLALLSFGVLGVFAVAWALWLFMRCSAESSALTPGRAWLAAQRA